MAQTPIFKNKGEDGAIPINADNLNNISKALLEILGLWDNTFSESSTYEVDDMVVYNHKIYACIEEITQAGSWDSSKWQEISLLINE